MKCCICKNFSIYRHVKILLSPCRNMDFKNFFLILLATYFHYTFFIHTLKFDHRFSIFVRQHGIYKKVNVKRICILRINIFHIAESALHTGSMTAGILWKEEFFSATRTKWKKICRSTITFMTTWCQDMISQRIIIIIHQIAASRIFK